MVFRITFSAESGGPVWLRALLSCEMCWLVTANPGLSANIHNSWPSHVKKGKPLLKILSESYTSRFLQKAGGIAVGSRWEILIGLACWPVFVEFSNLKELGFIKYNI